MKIALAQTRPVTGDIPANIDQHTLFIARAAAHHAELIVFPELSLTGYEPTLARQLATTPDDPRLLVFQRLADLHQLVIGVGLPTVTEDKPCISLVLFHPGQLPQIYSKQYLHEDELPYFSPGPAASGLLQNYPDIALAICYELSVPEHAEAAAKAGATVYIASVAKFKSGIEKAGERLSEIACIYSMAVLMCNCVGMNDGQECSGQSAVWDGCGMVLGQLLGTESGLLVVGTDNGDVLAVPVSLNSH